MQVKILKLQKQSNDLLIFVYYIIDIIGKSFESSLMTECKIILGTCVEEEYR